MIHVRRTAAPGSLVDANSPGERERQKWIEYYRVGHRRTPPDPKPKFKAYSLDSVKHSLLAMFHGKCAYCESKIEVVTWGDIEHYRPKGEIVLNDGTSIKPGYWWLASDWDNLLLACNRCNSVNNQMLLGGTRRESIGKGNLFPLDRDRRSRWPTDPHRWIGKDRGEAPLLIDPCRTARPEDSLECRTEPASLDRGAMIGRDAAGTASIRVFGLNRKPLVDERRKKLIDLHMLVSDLAELQDDIDELSGDIDRAIARGDATLQEQKERRLTRKMAHLAEKQRALEAKADVSEEFLSMTRPIIERALGR
ncbi:MAG: hypothetical protein AAF517_15480 [Planctomycetota bacterium]